jgi:hypothetical protein
VEIKNIFKNFFSTKYFAFFVYLVLAIVFWGIPMKFDFISRLNISGDPAFILWSLKWWPYAISHGLNPFLTKAFWAPFGQNLAWTNSVPSIALIFSPITIIFGPVFSYNLATILSLALGAFGIYLICNSLNLSRTSSMFGGLIFFFSSYVWGQLLGHLNLYVIFAVPFLIYLFVLRFNNKISSKKYIIFSGILLTFQFGVSNEIYATFIVFGFIALFILFLIFVKDEAYKKLIIKISLESIAAVILSIFLLSPYLYYIFYGYVKGPINPPSFYEADPLNFLIPTPITLLFGNLFSPISAKFAGNFDEEGAYLGLPLIFIVISFIKLSRQSKNKFYLFLTWLFVVLFIFSLGPYLKSLNHRLLLVLPWYIFTKMPLIEQALPTRFTLYIDIIAAIMSAVWFEKTNVNRALKHTISALAIIFLIPNLDMYRGQQIQYPEFISSGVYKKYIKQGENIIVYPTYVVGGFQGPLWQQKTDFYFNLSQGIAGPIPEELTKDSKFSWILGNFIWGQMSNSLAPISKYSFFSYLSRCNVGAIILPEDYDNPKVQKLLDLLDIKPISVDGVVIYQIDKNYIDSALKKLHSEYLRYFIDTFSTLLSSSQKFLSDGGDLSKLLPQYLEENGYLDKSFGYRTNKDALNWTKNGGWIGKWGCPDGKGECFAIGIVGDLDSVKLIIDKYKSQSLQIFFPYPKVYDPNMKHGEGQLLIVFRAPKVNNK